MPGLLKGAVAILFFVATARAELPPTPGAVGQTMARQLPAMPATPAQVLLPDQSASPVHDRKGKRFQVHSFRFVGATAFPLTRMKRIVERFVDLELNLYDLNLAADAVTEFYHDRGYSLARAIIPAQRVDEGVVTLVVVEGRVGGVLFSGSTSYDQEFLRPRLGDLVSGSLMETRNLERSLLLLNDLPGLRVRATLAPGADFGASDALIKMEEQRLAGSATVDNTGRAETGRWRLDLSGEWNNPTGAGDQLKLKTSATERTLTHSATLGYSIPIGKDGWRLAANYSDMKYDLAGAFAALGIQGAARTSDLSLSWPVTRSRSRNETLSMTARQTRLVQNTLGLETSRVTVPMMNFSYAGNWVDKDASVTNLSAQLSTNLRQNSDGASLSAMRYRAELDGTYLLPLDRFWDVFIRAAAAYSPDRLPDSEKYSIGGPSSVRAYRSSELRGDSGWQSTLEFRRSFSISGIPAALTFFGDMGRAVYKAPGFSNGSEGITAYGVGITTYPMRQTTVKLEAARAGNNQYRSGDGEVKRIWFSVNTSF